MWGWMLEELQEVMGEECEQNTFYAIFKELIYAIKILRYFYTFIECSLLTPLTLSYPSSSSPTSPLQICFPRP